MNIIKWVLGYLLLASLNVGYTHEHENGENHDMTPPDSLAINVAFDNKGSLWRVAVNDGFVEVNKSEDLGKTFSKPLHVNSAKQNITAYGEIRPKIAIGKSGEIYVAWMQNLKARFSGYIWFSRSVDGGKSFEPPFVVHHDRAEIGHAFEELEVSQDGRITMLWLDTRDLVAAKKAGKAHEGSSIYYAVSIDGGKSFIPEKTLVDGTCECCRLASVVKPDGTVVAMWRHVFEGGERDHAIAEIKPNTQPNIVRASFGHWKIDGCPHHGAALAYGAGFGYHMAYFDGAGEKPSLMYARMDGDAWVTSPPKKFGNMKNNAGHPALLSLGDKVWLVWREVNAEKVTEIYYMQSIDGGKSWTDTALMFSTKDKADYPQLVESKGKVYLSMNTVADGFKLIPFAE